jgi:hypothetical protein
MVKTGYQPHNFFLLVFGGVVSSFSEIMVFIEDFGRRSPRWFSGVCAPGARGKRLGVPQGSNESSPVSAAADWVGVTKGRPVPDGTIEHSVRDIESELSGTSGDRSSLRDGGTFNLRHEPSPPRRILGYFHQVPGGAKPSLSMHHPALKVRGYFQPVPPRRPLRLVR